MKFLFDLFPVILFFAVFKWGENNPTEAQNFIGQYLSALVSGGTVAAAQAPILLATAVAIIATIGQILYLFARRKKIDGMLWLSLAIITIFGGATIWFHNETFIKWKPTVLYWIFGAALIIGQIGFKRNLMRTMMEKQVALPAAVWTRLNYAWALFFIAMGLINLYVAYSFDTATWVNFKLFGFMGLMFGFIILQSLYLSKYMKAPE